MVSMESSYGEEEDDEVSFSIWAMLEWIGDKEARRRREETLERVQHSSTMSMSKKGKVKKSTTYIESEMGPTTNEACQVKNIDFRASDEFDEEGKNVCQQIKFPKSTYFKGFGDIRNCVQILCKKTVCP